MNDDASFLLCGHHLLHFDGHIAYLSGDGRGQDAGLLHVHEAHVGRITDEAEELGPGVARPPKPEPSGEDGYQQESQGPGPTQAQDGPTAPPARPLPEFSLQAGEKAGVGGRPFVHVLQATLDASRGFHLVPGFMRVHTCPPTCAPAAG